MANVIQSRFQGRFENVYKESGQSSVKMVDLLVTNFPNFQDHDLTKDLYFYKRSQILVADLYAQFRGKGRLLFTDIE